MVNWGKFLKVFAKLYDHVMKWSAHPKAPFFLAGMSFSESIFWPIPVDVMLAPMALKNRNKAWFFAGLATLFSVLGAMVGYALGLWAFEPLVAPLIQAVGYQHHFDSVQHWFEQYGIWIVFVAGFSPIPYKVITICAGLLSMAFLPFIIISLVARAMRFYLVAGLMVWGGESMENKLKDYIDILGWLTIAAAVVAYFILKM